MKDILFYPTIVLLDFLYAHFSPYTSPSTLHVIPAIRYFNGWHIHGDMSVAISLRDPVPQRTAFSLSLHNSVYQWAANI